MPDVGVSPLTMIGPRITAARKARGLTKKALHAALPASSLDQVEKGEDLFYADTLRVCELEKLAQTLDCSIGYLLGEHAYLPKGDLAL